LDFTYTINLIKNNIVTNLDFPIFFLRKNTPENYENNPNFSNGFILEPLSNTSNNFIDVLENKIFKNKSNKFLTITKNSERIKINCENILFIKSSDNYIEIFTHNSKHRTRTSLKSIIEKSFYSDYFIQTHRSYVVNKKYVTKCKSDKIYINDISVPISRKFKSAVNQLFK